MIYLSCHIYIFTYIHSMVQGFCWYVKPEISIVYFAFSYFVYIYKMCSTDTGTDWLSTFSFITSSLYTLWILLYSGPFLTHLTLPPHDDTRKGQPACNVMSGWFMGCAYLTDCCPRACLGFTSLVINEKTLVICMWFACLPRKPLIVECPVCSFYCLTRGAMYLASLSPTVNICITKLGLLKEMQLWTRGVSWRGLLFTKSIGNT